MAPPKASVSVAIIGGGIGGLALANRLRNTGVYVTVYERDPDDGSRAQGYQLGIQKDGFEALMKAVPDLDVDAIFDTKFGISSFTITDPELYPLLNIGIPRPEGRKQMPGTVNRVALRQALAENLRRDSKGDGRFAGILYGKKFKSFAKIDGGEKVVAYFEDASDTGPVDVLVGADGARSLIRASLFPEIEYKQLPVLNIGASVALDDLPSFRKPGSRLAAVMTPRNTASLVRAVDRIGSSILLLPWQDRATGRDSMVWAVTLAVGHSEQRMLKQANTGVEKNDLGRVLHDLCRERARDAAYAAEIQEAIACATPEQLVFTASLDSVHCHSIQLPKNLKLTPTRVVLLGDAAHATTTHAGLGANTALQDAIDLAEKIIAVGHKGDVRQLPLAMAEYHKAMFKRGAKVIGMSTGNTGMITSSGWRATVRDVFLKVVFVFVKIWRGVKSLFSGY
ncbi:hypothetical protein HDU87_005790 [Geranomyces variabilis]|uniref:FAD-binding domain-containing protein n=1 Tax=Geranomyces variabilis TaxID=109894 RepID=A0AAD5TIN2_9FUNG|nr:hypothetical protein HDU87_005790 [Geranomyces variabilis]